MGRKRLLANIHSQDYKLRTQAERQAVNFVVQGKNSPMYLPTYLPSIYLNSNRGHLFCSQKNEYSHSLLK